MNLWQTFLIMSVALLAPHLNETHAKMYALASMCIAFVFFVIEFIIEARK